MQKKKVMIAIKDVTTATPSKIHTEEDIISSFPEREAFINYY